MWSPLPCSSSDAHSSLVLSFCPTIFLSRSISYWHERVKISCGLTGGPGFWVMTECPSDYLWDLCSYFGDHLWSLDISPRLSLTLSSHPGMNDEVLVMTMTDLDFSSPCCLVFVKSHLVTCHIQTNINSVMKHKYSWVMSDHLGSNATGMMRLFYFFFSLDKDVLYFHRFVKRPGPDRLRVIYFLIRAIIQLYCPGRAVSGPHRTKYFYIRVSFPPPLSLMLRLIPISPDREEDYFTLQCSCIVDQLKLFSIKRDFIFCPQPSLDVLSSLSLLISPRPRTMSDCRNLWENADRDNERLFVNGAFCINQLTVGRGQQKLRKAMEISSKTSSKGRKSWMWKLMVRPGALWDV